MCIQEILIYTCGHRIKGTLDSTDCNPPLDSRCTSTIDDIKYRSDDDGEKGYCPSCIAACIADDERTGKANDSAGMMQWDLTEVGWWKVVTD